MFVGIICSCMPSAAHTLRQMGPAFDALKPRLYSGFKSLGSSVKRSKESKSVTERVDYNERRGSYINLENSKTPNQAQHSNVHTVIGTGIPSDVESKGIHVDHRLQTSWESI